MATILSFPASTTARRPVAIDNRDVQAAIIIFPGVRQETLDKTGKSGQATAPSLAKPFIQ